MPDLVKECQIQREVKSAVTTHIPHPENKVSGMSRKFGAESDAREFGLVRGAKSGRHQSSKKPVFSDGLRGSFRPPETARGFLVPRIGRFWSFRNRYSSLPLAVERHTGKISVSRFQRGTQCGNDSFQPAWPLVSHTRTETQDVRHRRLSNAELEPARLAIPVS